MSDLLRLVRFELRYYLRRISTWVYFVILAFLAYLMMITFAGAFPEVSASMEGTDGNVLVNSTHVLMMLTSIFALFGTLVVAAVAGDAGFRDFSVGMHPLVFTTPVPKSRYVASRYIGAVIVNILVLSGIGFGLWLGSVMPFVETDRLGPNTLLAYLQPYLVIVIPNTLFTTAIFVAMALLTRKRLPHYLGGAALLLGYMVSQVLMPDLETKWIATLADPFGITSVGVATDYWTTVEKNSQLIWFDGLILWNRVLWIGISVAIVALASWRFRFSQSAGEGRRRARAVEPDELAMAAPPSRIEIPPARRSFGFGAMLLQLRSLTARGFREVVASPYFAAIILAGVLFLIMNSLQLETIYGTRTWPMAWKVIEILGGSFALFVVILVTLYAGELVWRERDLKLDQVVDATPTPSWISYVSKLIALSVMVLVLIAVIMVAGMATQAVLGFFRFEPGLYFQKLVGMELPDYLLLCVLALAVHTLVNHKYTGHFILILFYLALDMLPFMGLEHSMWQYASDLGDTYSDMNRHGWFLGPFVWFKLYWAGMAILLAVASNLLWPRGVDGRIRSRFNSARLRVRATAIAAAVVGVVFSLGAGGFLYYNTNILNTYRDSSASEMLQADYEKKYKQYEGLAQPRITDVSLQVDLFPEEGDVFARGTYRLVNRTNEPIDRIHVLLDPDAGVRELEFGVPAEIDHENVDTGYRIFALETPLAPGETTTLGFDLAYERDGFSHSIETAVVHNGSFVNSSILPSFGYDPNFELTLDRTRKKHDLEPKERMRDLDDPVGRNDNYITRDADWVNFEVILSTSSDQVALAPGYIQREWEKDGRRYFHYAMDAPILNFFSFLSARYEVVSDRWNDVAIEVYYHPGHEFNLDRMIDSVKKSLDYFSTEFSPYQHRQVRILEFPRYASFAQSFPNTIPYSESIGFIARLKDDDIDYPFYVTAHEIAHQWWAHQVIGANVQGATVLSETLAQYSALMVMEREYGPDKIRRFLEYELDMYLRGRSTERKKEVPLLRVENQPYIHYRKGSVIMYALKDAIGEEAVNRALSGFLEQWAFKGPPYPTSRDLVEAFRAEAPEDLHSWLDDLFAHITLYENRATEATAREIEDGRYEVTLTFEARKLRAGEQGEETEVALDDPIDIGVFDDEGRPLYLESHRLNGKTSQVTVVVDGVPARAGIDPYHKLIDRHPDDNETSLN
jgi:ABC-type transport system involved in multi-copper enzyme maturation permease subunit